MNSAITFQLSEPGSSLQRDPVMSEYLRSYGFPLPPTVRYGFTRIDSPQAHERVNLFGQAWLPEGAKGTVLLIHGYSEHSGNYAQLVHDLVNARYAVAAMDLRGHGLSEGPRGHVGTPHTYAEDIEAFAAHVIPILAPHRPIFIWAHSLGSLIGLQLLLRKKLFMAPLAGIFSSALLGYPPLSGLQKILAAFAPVMSKLLPTLPVSHGISSTSLSHDEEYLAKRFEDPLVNHVSSPRWFTATKESMRELQEHAKEFQDLSPSLFLLAGDEKITNLNEARKFAFQAYGSMKHKVIEFPGYYHELEKEPGIRNRVISESLAWLNSHQR